MRFFLCGIVFLMSVCSFASAPVVHNTLQGIELRNDHVSMVLNSRAEMISCLDLATGNNIAAQDYRGKVASASFKNGNTQEADRIALNGNSLLLYFGSNRVELEILPFKDYFTVEVKKVPPRIESLTFMDLRMNYSYSKPSTAIATGVAMTLQTNPVYYPSGEKKAIVGRCYSHTGLLGAKLAIIVCQKNDLKTIIKKVYESVPKGVLPINKTGGPYAQDSVINRYDCVLIRDANPAELQKQIEFYSKFGIRQFDFLPGSSSFIQGSFSFPSMGSVNSFKQNISDPLTKAGIKPMMHTYSFYISYNAKEILSNPKWQQQLLFRETFTLSKALSINDSSISVVGEESILKGDDSFWASHSPYLLIDNEVIKYSIGRDGFLNCQRGQCGTKATSHTAGAIVKIIGGRYSHIAPYIGSDLFYEIARKTAETYNEGGFRGIYFDAFDGLESDLKSLGLLDFKWYYGAAFINEVLKYCNEPPLIEYSDMIATIWSGRGRGESWDTPNRGYKNFVDDHMMTNKVLMDRLYVTTLGWFHFYPTKKDQPGDYSTKYMFFDDVDYLGAKVVAYDQAMIYNGLVEKEYERFPALKRNMEEYSTYTRLRQDGYFSDRVKTVLKEGLYEYKLELRGGVWGFKEAVYNRRKIRDIMRDQLSGNNPFTKQKPFIRLENLYTSDCSSSIPLLSFNQSVDVFSQIFEKSFSSPLDLSAHLAIRITVNGKGSESSDALCIRIRSSDSSGYADYVVRLDFEGWRDIVLPNLDNAENPELKFVGMEDNAFKMHRRDVDFTKVKSIKVFKTVGCKDVRVRDIKAVPLVSNPLTNPTVHWGSSSIRFLDTLKSGEYIEFSTGKSTTAFIYDRIGNSRSVRVMRSGSLQVPNGPFSATVSGTSQLKNAPTEVVLTFGLYGQFIKN